MAFLLIVWLASLPQFDSQAVFKDKLYLRNQPKKPTRTQGSIPGREKAWGRDHLSNTPIRTLQPSRAGPKAWQSAQVRGRAKAGPPPARAHLSLSPLPSGGGLLGARAPAHRPGSAPRPAARSRPRAEATQSRSPTQRRWRRRQRRGLSGRSAGALRAHLPHPGHRPGHPPSGLRWRRRQRRSKRWPRVKSVGEATTVRLRTPGSWHGSRRYHGFLALLPARSGLEGMRLYVLLGRPFCRLRLSLPSAAPAILCPGPGLRAAHALVPPRKDLAAPGRHLECGGTGWVLKPRCLAAPSSTSRFLLLFHAGLRRAGRPCGPWDVDRGRNELTGTLPASVSHAGMPAERKGPVGGAPTGSAECARQGARAGVKRPAPAPARGRSPGDAGRERAVDRAPGPGAARPLRPVASLSGPLSGLPQPFPISRKHAHCVSRNEAAQVASALE